MIDESRVPELAELIVKKLRSTLSIKEEEELEAWITENPSNKEFMETRMTQEKVFEGVIVLLEKSSERMRRKFDKMISQLK